MIEAVVPKIHAAMCKVMGEIGSIEKSRRSNNGSFRSIDDIYNAVNEVFSSNGIYASGTIIDKVIENRLEKNKEGGERTNCIRIYIYEWIFTCADDGSQSRPHHTAGEASDYGDKASSKAMTYAYKNALLQVFNIRTEKKKALDPPATTAVPKGEEQSFRDRIKQKTEEADANKTRQAGEEIYLGTTDQQTRVKAFLESWKIPNDVLTLSKFHENLLNGPMSKLKTLKDDYLKDPRSLK